jgi:hypothetical protein
MVLEEVKAEPDVAKDMRPMAGCPLRRQKLLRCFRRCSLDALRMATALRSRSRARVRSPGACLPQLLIDGCAVNTALRCTTWRANRRVSALPFGDGVGQWVSA